MNRTGRESSSKARTLSEPQAALVAQLKRGAVLTHEVSTTGRFRLTEGGRSRTIHPATAQSLIDAGILLKSLLGECRLDSAA